MVVFVVHRLRFPVSADRADVVVVVVADVVVLVVVVVQQISAHVKFALQTQTGS